MLGVLISSVAMAGLGSGTALGTATAAASGDTADAADGTASALAAAGVSATPGYASYGTAGGFHGRGWISAGGTSLATPLWAALTALADQQTPAAGYQAGPGYDMPPGWARRGRDFSPPTLPPVVRSGGGPTAYGPRPPTWAP